MFEFFRTTGFDECLMLAIAMVGIPWAMWFDAKRKPGVTAPGQDEN